MGSIFRMCFHLGRRDMAPALVTDRKNSSECITSSNHKAATLRLSQDGWVLSPRVKVAQLCPTLCDPMDCRPPSSSVHGIFQARILEWVAIPFSRGSFGPRNQTQFCFVDRFFTICASRGTELRNNSQLIFCITQQLAYESNKH